VALIVQFFNCSKLFFWRNFYFSIVNLSEFEFLRGNWPFQYHKIAKKKRGEEKGPTIGAFFTSFISIFCDVAKVVIMQRLIEANFCY
jgi:hypothetical protein